MLTIYASVSINESFGVAALEASACAKPVVVSNIGGFLETVKDGESGYLVPPKDPKNIAEVIEKMLINRDLITEIGNNGRKRVKEFFNWNNNVKQMLEIYNKIKKSKNN